MAKKIKIYDYNCPYCNKKLTRCTTTGTDKYKYFCDNCSFNAFSHEIEVTLTKEVDPPKTITIHQNNTNIKNIESSQEEKVKIVKGIDELLKKHNLKSY